MTLYLFPSPIHSKPNLIHAVLHIPLDRRNPTTNRFCLGQSRSTHQCNPMVMQWRTNNRVYLILLLRQKKPLSLSANRKDYIQLRALLLFISRHSVDRAIWKGKSNHADRNVWGATQPIQTKQSLFQSIIDHGSLNLEGTVTV